MTDILISKVEVLIQQHRYAEAQKLLNDLIRQDPNNPHYLALACQISLELGDVKKSKEQINAAIGIFPDEDYLHYIKARVLLAAKEYDKAEYSLDTAIRLEPNQADYYALWASIKLSRKQFEKALELANKSLELDSENILGLNIRSTSLLKLKRVEESSQTIEGALREDPNNELTHSNYGWNLLEAGDHEKALVHFKEALKINPNSQFAQSGMVEALKGKYLVYRWFHKYVFFMSNLTAKYQWSVIIGYYVVYRVLSSIAKNVAALAPVLNPLLILLAIVAFSTWVISPISNLMFRLNKYGKYLLNKKEMLSSNFVGVSALVCILAIVLYFVLGDEKWLSPAAFGFSMMIPLSVMFSKSKKKHTFLIYTIALFVIGMLSIVTTFGTGEVFNTFSTVYILGLFAFQWVVNAVMIKKDNI